MLSAHEEPQPRFGELFRMMWHVLSLTWQAGPYLVIALVIPTIFQAVLPPATLALSRAVTDRAAFDRGLLPELDPLIASLPLAGWAVLAAGALALLQVVPPIASSIQSMIGDRLGAAFGLQIIRAANAWPGIRRLEDPDFADDLHLVRYSSAQLGLELILFVVHALIALVMLIVLGVFLITLHPLAPLFLILVTFPQMRQVFAYGHLTRSHLYVQTPAARQLEYSRDVTLTPETAKDVRLYHLVPFFRQRYDYWFGETLGILNTKRWQETWRIIATGILAIAGAGAVISWLIVQAASGIRTPGEFVLYAGTILLFQQQLLSFGNESAMLPFFFGQAIPSLQRVLAAPPDLPLAANPVAVAKPLSSGIVFDKVSFTYPHQSTPVLDDLSFEIQPGECVALVGLNGAGKTTITKLLLRLYDPTSGRILLNGVDLRAYDIDNLRRQMAVIFQDFARFAVSVAENVGFGQLDSLHDDARIRHALAQVNATDLLETLPDGLATVLGREFGGRDLSGGEWQKLALARARMRDCPILVLDEPTAALDVEAEEAVYTRFRELINNRMTVLISHRFATVRMADRILLLHQGQVTESGTHHELLDDDGIYARLYRSQAARYQEEDADGSTA